jgi:hypothetical protein
MNILINIDEKYNDYYFEKNNLVCCMYFYIPNYENKIPVDFSSLDFVYVSMQRKNEFCIRFERMTLYDLMQKEICKFFNLKEDQIVFRNITRMSRIIKLFYENYDEKEITTDVEDIKEEIRIAAVSLEYFSRSL